MELDKTPTTCNRALGLWVQGWLAGGLAVGLAGWLAGYIPTCLRRPRRFHHWRDVIVAARSKRALTEVTLMRVQQSNGLAPSRAHSQDLADLSYDCGEDLIVDPRPLSTPQFPLQPGNGVQRR